jgi:hypothetical protein
MGIALTLTLSPRRGKYGTVEREIRTTIQLATRLTLPVNLPSNKEPPLPDPLLHKYVEEREWTEVVQKVRCARADRTPRRGVPTTEDWRIALFNHFTPRAAEQFF